MPTVVHYLDRDCRLLLELIDDVAIFFFVWVSLLLISLKLTFYFLLGFEKRFESRSSERSGHQEAAVGLGQPVRMQDTDSKSFAQDQPVPSAWYLVIWPALITLILKTNTNLLCKALKGKNPFTPCSGFTPGTPIFTHYTPARQRYFPTERR